MKTTPAVEFMVYLVVITLTLALLGLAAISPAIFLDVSSVYQGF